MEDKGKRVSMMLALWHGNGVDQLLACVDDPNGDVVLWSLQFSEFRKWW